MCECQPDIVMFSEFQPPLFQRYDLSVEFLRRRRRVKELLEARWQQLRSKVDEEIAAEIVDLCRIEPLRLALQHARLVVEPSGYGSSPDEPCYFYRKFIPFEGDAELWELSPEPGLREEAEGAVAYLEYVTGVLDTNERSALQHLSRQIRIATRKIALQEGRIRLFNESLFTTVGRELAKLRRFESKSWWDRPIGSA